MIENAEHGSLPGAYVCAHSIKNLLASFRLRSASIKARTLQLTALHQAPAGRCGHANHAPVAPTVMTMVQAVSQMKCNTLFF
jgi:hypothetical protein